MTISNEAFLTGLGYTPTDALLTQLETIEESTKNFEQISKHILNLNEQLKPYNSFVALSNTNNYVKIKNQAKDGFVMEVNNIIESWASKYKIDLEKVPNKEPFYIKGYAK
ncbi:MAG: hypothetical protein ACK5LP_04030 [Campylobacteraceae bacterium]